MQEIVHEIETTPIIIVTNDCPLKVFRTKGLQQALYGDRKYEFCEKCDFFYKNNHCRYHIYKTELLKHNSECDDDDGSYTMPQTSYSWDFKCANCGKLIHFSSGFSVLQPGDTERCFHCKTKHRLITYRENRYEFAIPVVD